MHQSPAKCCSSCFSCYSSSFLLKISRTKRNIKPQSSNTLVVQHPIPYFNSPKTNEPKF